MKINVEIDRIRIDMDGTVIHLTREGIRDLQKQLDDILGLIECEQPKLGPFTVTINPYTFTWDDYTTDPS